MAYTKEQLEKMGAKPVTATSTPGKLTRAELEAAGATLNIPGNNIGKNVGSFIGNLAGAIVRPFDRLGASVQKYGGGAAAFGADKALGTNQYKDYSDAVKSVEKRMTAPTMSEYLSGIKAEPVKSAKDLAGVALEAGATFIPVGAGLKGFKAIGDGIKTGAKAGAAVGAGQSLQQEESTVPDTIRDTAVGGLFGGALGGTFSTAINIPSVIKGIPQIPGRLNDAIVKGQVPQTTLNVLNPSKNIDTAKTAGIEFSVPNLKAKEGDPKFYLKQVETITPDEMKAFTEENSKAYVNYLNESKKNITGGQSPDPLRGSVSKNISNAVDQVQTIRREIGKKIGDIESRYKDTMGPLGEDLILKAQNLQSFIEDGIRLGADPAENKMTSTFLKNIGNLMNEPTVENRKRIIRYWSEKIKDASDPITGSMPSDMVRINSIVRDLENETRSLIPDKTYQEVMAQYGDLKKFEQEAAKLLGRDSVEGNAIRGGGTAKRAVQSISDGGAMDFLIALRRLTGYDGLKDARIAIQAMRDAGDFKQASLLETALGKWGATAGVDIPMSKSGVIGKVADATIGAATRALQKKIVGDPTKRIQQYINDVPQTAKPQTMAEFLQKNMRPGAVPEQTTGYVDGAGKSRVGTIMEVSTPTSDLKVKGKVERVPLTSIKPTQSGEDLYNETSEGYARGDIVENIFQPNERMVNVGPLRDPEQLPPIIVDETGKIVDGNHRWAAAEIAGLKDIDVVRTKSTSKQTTLSDKRGGIGTPDESVDQEIARLNKEMDVLEDDMRKGQEPGLHTQRTNANKYTPEYQNLVQKWRNLSNQIQDATARKRQEVNQKLLLSRRLEDIKSGIETDNYTANNIEWLITRLQKDQISLKGALDHIATIENGIESDRYTMNRLMELRKTIRPNVTGKEGKAGSDLSFSNLVLPGNYIKTLEGVSPSVRNLVAQEDFTNIKGIDPKDIEEINIFGSSVEGKKNPRDIDVMVRVKNNGYFKLKNEDDLTDPIVIKKGKFQYFIMPDEQADMLLDAMLYTGRKDGRDYTGTAIELPRRMWKPLVPRKKGMSADELLLGGSAVGGGASSIANFLQGKKDNE